MPSSVQLQVSIAGGAYVSGATQAAAGQTLNMQAVGASQLTSIRYDIYDYPPGFALPAGWTQDAVTGAYYFAPTNVTTAPPTVTLGGGLWGPYMLRVRGNGNPLRLNPDGSPNAAFNSSLTDETTLVYVLSPIKALKGVGFGETTQRDAMRGYAGPIMSDLRKLDSGSAGTLFTVTGNPAVDVLNTTTETTLTTYTLPANTLPTNGTLYFFAELALFNNSLANVTTTLRLYWGGSVLHVFSLLNSTSPTNILGVEIEARITATGATNTQMSNAHSIQTQSGAFGTATTTTVNAFTGINKATIDTTVAQVLQLTTQSSTNTATQFVDIYGAKLILF